MFGVSLLENQVAFLFTAFRLVFCLGCILPIPISSLSACACARLASLHIGSGASHGSSPADAPQLAKRAKEVASWTRLGRGRQTCTAEPKTVCRCQKFPKRLLACLVLPCIPGFALSGDGENAKIVFPVSLPLLHGIPPRSGSVRNFFQLNGILMTRKKTSAAKKASLK